jgi:hypothetical protein
MRGETWQNANTTFGWSKHRYRESQTDQKSCGVIVRLKREEGKDKKRRKRARGGERVEEKKREGGSSNGCFLPHQWII